MINFLAKIRSRFIRGFEKDIDYYTLLELQKNTNCVLIDVRTKEEFGCGHIKEAINIPLQDFNDKFLRLAMKKDDIIIVYCQYGGRSKKACKKLDKLGYVNVYNLKGRNR